jgi:hypothetical protein
MDAYVPDAARIAAQNDAFRAHACGGVPYPPGGALRGCLLCTAAVAAEGYAFAAACRAAVAAQTEFLEEDDPDGLHDFGAVEVLGRRVWWKIDLYADESLAWGSEHPDDPERTVRVLTILFPEDW